LFQVSDRNVTTNYGKTESEEMCVLLLTYYIDPRDSTLPESSWLPGTNIIKPFCSVNCTRAAIS
jgi:hypothetical protein